MKKEIIECVESDFMNFEGVTQKIVVAAVSMPTSLCIIDSPTVVNRKLGIGFAICDPNDEYNFELGKTIAVNRAKDPSNKYQLYVSFPGMINTKVVQALLEQEIDYFRQNPDSHIPGYKEAERKYKDAIRKEAIKNAIEHSLTDEEQSLLATIRNLPDDSRKNIMALLNENLWNYNLGSYSDCADFNRHKHLFLS